MKKLMIALAAVAMAAASQAASVYWGYSGTAKDETVKGSHIYLVVGAETPESIDNMATWLSGQTVVSDKATTWATMPTKQAKVSAFATSSDNITKDKSYFFVLVNSDSSQYQLSGVYAGSDIVYDPAAQESQKTTSLNGSSFGAWKDVGGGGGGDVPEPTSGLLLVLGMAGLALRRKHA